MARSETDDVGSSFFVLKRQTKVKQFNPNLTKSHL
jgi:hypothetical protein